VSNQLSLADSGASNSGTLGSAAPHATNWAGADAGLLATPAPNAALMSASTASTASASVAAPVGSDQFASETAAKILYFAQNNIQSAQLSLNPAHLGPLDVQIRMSGEQVNLALSSAHADTRHALEAGLPKLREMFSEQGIQIGDVSVGARAFSQGSGSQYPSNSSNPGQTNPGSNGAAGGDPDAAPSAVRATVRSLQLVDTFA
jgi:flagellar hook-length control protein FliK